MAWYGSRYNWNFDPQALIFSPLAIGCWVNILRAFTKLGDAVLFMTPLYPPLQNAVEAEGRKAIRFSMQNEPGGVHGLDLQACRELIFEAVVHAFSCCAIHTTLEGAFGEGRNSLRFWPCAVSSGSSWSAMRSGRIGACGAKKYCPAASVARSGAEVITIIGSNKTWNLAGLQTAFVVIEDAEMRSKYRSVIDHCHGDDPGIFNLVGSLAAYRSGGPWLSKAKAYVENNMREVEAFFLEHLPKVRVWHPQATYLMWLDFSGLGLAPEEVTKRLLAAGVVLKPGGVFGPEAMHFRRLNCGVARSTLLEALRRIGVAMAMSAPSND